MQKNDSYPTSDQIREQERKFTAGRMEEEAKLRSVYGSPEDREHERLRVGQEWDKIDRDKAQGLNDDLVWRNHLDRMKRMARSLRDAGKATRRAKHFELAGLSTAAGLFQEMAEYLGRASKKPLDAQKDILISNLDKFNEFVADLAKHQAEQSAAEIEKLRPRRVGEIWTRPGGARVTKLPNGNIVPYEGHARKEQEIKRQEKSPEKKGAAVPKKDTALAEDDRFSADLGNGSRVRYRRGPDGSLINPIFLKSEDELERAVREYLAHQQEKTKYVLVRDMTEEQRKDVQFRKYNSGIGQAETYARAYGYHGLKQEARTRASHAERRFWLGMCLVMKETAEEFGRLRDGEGKKK